MAWELQTHMHAYVAPSVAAAAKKTGDAVAWLQEVRRFQLGEHHGEEIDESLLDVGQSALLSQVVEHALTVGSTSVGGHEVWLDAGGWRDAPWCDDDAMLAWHG